MTQKLVIALFSDSHLLADPTGLRLSVNPYENFSRVVEALSKALGTRRLDAVVHLGDVAGGQELGEAPAYDLAESLLSKLSSRRYYVAGNHDDPKHIRRICAQDTQPLVPGEQSAAYMFQLDWLPCIVLDARIDERAEGMLPESQIEKLDKELRQAKQALVFLHYPVLELDVEWCRSFVSRSGAADTMFIRNRQDVQGVLEAHAEKIIGVFHGHVHASCVRLYQGVRYVSVVSSHLQLNVWPGETHPAWNPDAAIGAEILVITKHPTGAVEAELQSVRV